MKLKINDNLFNIKSVLTSKDTQNGMMNKKAQIEEWFDATKYPQIKFVSTKITKSGKSEDSYSIVGNIKIKGAVKETKIPVIYSKSGDGAKFSGSFNVKRSDFKVGHKGDVVPDIMKIDFVVPVVKK